MMQQTGRGRFPHREGPAGRLWNGACNVFDKILIANRGEIAVRVIRACADMGIRTVAVYSTADQDALHTQMADEAVCIGPPAARDSYLNMPAILSATVLTGSQAIHPGFGFLSENSRFAAMCRECNIVFIGPPAEAMDAMGHKLRARLTMIGGGVPVIPGSSRLVETDEDALQDARATGYPLLVKAAAGGGGRGIRRVNEEGELLAAVSAARAEALACFGDEGVYIEKLIEKAHHIEFQILCDMHGNAVHLFERDCSMQRRRQKVVEECPSSLLTPAVRAAMGEAAVRAARACGYVGAGTVEFLVDDQLNYYFMEMNARIQVEHPVTEAVTGVDLVAAQIEVADGRPLPFAQADLRITGHAIECRLCAEDPQKGFRPSVGKVNVVHMPGGPGVRVDSMLYSGMQLSPHYDSMMAKLIVHAADRPQALARMKRALNEVVIEGVTTNTEFLFDLVSLPQFAEGRFHTSTLEEAMG